MASILAIQETVAMTRICDSVEETLRRTIEAYDKYGQKGRSLHQSTTCPLSLVYCMLQNVPVILGDSRTIDIAAKLTPDLSPIHPCLTLYRVRYDSRSKNSALGNLAD